MKNSTFQIGQLVSARENGITIEGIIAKIYDGSLWLKDVCSQVIYATQSGDEILDYCDHEDCEVFFNQIQNIN